MQKQQISPFIKDLLKEIDLFRTGQRLPAHSITYDIKGGGEFRRTTPEKRLPPGPGGDTPHNGLYGEVPPKRVGISPVEVYERVGKSVISVY